MRIREMGDRDPHEEPHRGEEGTETAHEAQRNGPMEEQGWG